MTVTGAADWTPGLRVLSLGAGVQSTTLALMAAHGEVGPMPDCAIFADTGDEPEAVYVHLDWLRSGNVLPYPVHVVSRPYSLSSVVLESARAKREGRQLYGQKGSPPYFVREPGQDARDRSMLPRQCTANFKVDVIEGFLRRLLGDDKPGQDPVIESWIGISADEAQRMKPSRRPWIRNRYPLAMELGLHRHQCLGWLERHGYPRPPRSACWHCPYRSDREWRELRDHHAADWRRAVAFDTEIRGGLEGFTRLREVFLHASCVPLDQVDLSTAEDGGQYGLWPEECEGMCGV